MGMPNMLEGVKIPEGVERTGDECSVCLDPPVHPVSLPCGHIFCYLCAKGLGAGLGTAKLCSLCRRPIPHGFLESAEVLAKASQELNDTPPVDAADLQWQWFYEGRNGWWRFESRNNDDLEEAFSEGKQQVETLICGNIYVIDLASMEQFQKSMPQRKRRIKRDLKTAQCKGVAGLGKSSWQWKVKTVVQSSVIIAIVKIWKGQTIICREIFVRCAFRLISKYCVARFEQILISIFWLRSVHIQSLV